MTVHKCDKSTSAFLHADGSAESRPLWSARRKRWGADAPIGGVRLGACILTELNGVALMGRRRGGK